jgi:hypothetical protein
MKHNIGSVDRVIRVVIGLAIIVAGVLAKSWWGLLGILPLLTAVVRWCPAYLPFGISTSTPPGPKPGN